MNRFRIITLLAALLALAIGAVACGGGDEDAGEVLGNASLEGVESGKVDLSLHVESGNSQGESLDVSLSGPFQGRGKDLPWVDLAITAKGTARGEDIDFEGGLTLLADRGFLNYEGTEYEIDPEYFNLAKPTFLPPKPGQGKEGSAFALNACLEAAAGLDLAEFGDNLRDEGSAEVGGVSTTKVSGDLDVAAAFDALVQLAENPSCSAQLAAAGRGAEELKKLGGELAGSVKRAHVEIYVGDDDIIRKVAGELVAAPKGSKPDPVEADFELVLSEVNEGPKIDAPAGGQPILVWLEGLGVDPFSAYFLVSESEGLARILELAAADAFPSVGGLAGGG